MDGRTALADAHRQAIAAARADGVELLLFPELSVTGYAPAVAAWRDGTMPTRADALELARDAGPMAVCLGLPEEGATGQLHNVQLVIHDGAVVHAHRKLTLPTYGALEEGKHFTPGRSVRVFPLHGWRVAVLTCADLWNPALSWLAALSGADLLLAPVASMAGAVDASFDTAAGWEVVLRHTSMMYGLPVVMANYTGGGFWGGSSVLGASGDVLAGPAASPGLLSATIERSAIRHARRLLPTMRDAAPELVARELGRIAEDRKG